MAVRGPQGRDLATQVAQGNHILPFLFSIDKQSVTKRGNVIIKVLPDWGTEVFWAELIFTIRVYLGVTGLWLCS